MARQRLTWAKKAAEADPYSMNQDHQNPPVEKYKTGDPSSWAEDPDMRKPWQGEGRNEVGLPAPAAEKAPAAPAPAPEAAPEEDGEAKAAHDAVKSATAMQDKALKCITIAQHMLPGADDDMIEKQAKALMFLPEESVISTLQRQASLAKKLASDEAPVEEKQAGDDEEAPEPEKDEEEKEEKTAEEAAPAPEAPAPEKTAEEEVPAEVPAEEKKDEEKTAEEAPGEKVIPEGTPKEMEEEADKEASADVLDMLFNEPVKTGAKKLSGMVKQASASGDNLSGLWPTAPDVSEAFK